jgi:hypothetical protein
MVETGHLSQGATSITQLRAGKGEVHDLVNDSSALSGYWQRRHDRRRPARAVYDGLSRRSN